MKPFLSLFLLFFATSCIAQAGKLNVQLVVPKEKSEEFTHPVKAVLKSETTTKTIVLSFDYTFEFDSLSAGTFSLSISSLFFPDTVIENIVITNNSAITLMVNYPPVCKYDKSKNDKTCPACHKKDQVIPIVYGLLISTGKSKKKEDEIYSGGCEVTGCDPHWHCKRDNTDF